MATGSELEIHLRLRLCPGRGSLFAQAHPPHTYVYVLGAYLVSCICLYLLYLCREQIAKAAAQRSKRKWPWRVVTGTGTETCPRCYCCCSDVVAAQMLLLLPLAFIHKNPKRQIQFETWLQTRIHTCLKSSSGAAQCGKIK